MVFGTKFKDTKTNILLTLFLLYSSTILAIGFPNVLSVISLIGGTVGVTIGAIYPTALYIKCVPNLRLYKKIVLYLICLTVVIMGATGAVVAFAKAA